MPTSTEQPPGADVPARRRRVAAIDWMRGLVMILMTIDHAAMAFDRTHIDEDSAMYAHATTMALPAAEFLTRWLTHVCAPTFVFLAGTALALSIERKSAKGADPWEIDQSILKRGAFIALLDPTLISLGSGKLLFGVLFAIGVSMMCMAALRRLPTWALVALGGGWIALGEVVTGAVWHPPGSAPPWAAILFATYAEGWLVIKYPVVPWLALMVLGWVLGRYMVQYSAGTARTAPATLLLVGGLASLALFFVVRWQAGYGDMFLPRADGSWQQWLHVSKYPPSLTFYTLELGMVWVLLALMMRLEPLIGVRDNGLLLVYGQTAMFFYLVHRLVMEVPATWFGLRGFGDLTTTYIVAAVLLIGLYAPCLWYRSFKAAHPDSLLKYI